MSSKLKLKSTAGGSVSLTVDDTLATDVEYEVPSIGSSGKVLTGQDLTDVGIIGANPEATLWADGSITGSSDYGTFTKWANGQAEMMSPQYISASLTANATTLLSNDIPLNINASMFTAGTQSIAGANNVGWLGAVSYLAVHHASSTRFGAGLNPGNTVQAINYKHEWKGRWK